MKVLITSTDALVDSETEEFFEGIEDALDGFLALDVDNKVIVISVSAEKLKAIPDKYNPFPIKAKYRGSAALITLCEEEYGVEFSDIMVLGCKDRDMYMAANAKILLLTAKYAENNNPEEAIYTTGYGLQITSPDRLTFFFNHFLNIDTPWYFKLPVSETTEIYALTNANTYSASKDMVRMNNEFSACLKEGNGTFRNLFTIYFLLSTYRIFKELQGVKYWGIYPSSGTELNQDLEYFKEQARKSFGCKTSHPLFLKQRATPKRHDQNKATRKARGCQDQLESIVINPWYKGRLSGETVCVIDDFTTYGTSCETARHLLEAAGVEKLIFIALGKFGKEYIKYDYDLETLPNGLYTGLTCEYVDADYLDGEFNTASNRSLIDSLGDLI